MQALTCPTMGSIPTKVPTVVRRKPVGRDPDQRRATAPTTIAVQPSTRPMIHRWLSLSRFAASVLRPASRRAASLSRFSISARRRSKALSFLASCVFMRSPGRRAVYRIRDRDRDDRSLSQPKPAASLNQGSYPGRLRLGDALAIARLEGGLRGGLKHEDAARREAQNQRWTIGFGIFSIMG